MKPDGAMFPIFPTLESLFFETVRFQPGWFQFKHEATNFVFDATNIFGRCQRNLSLSKWALPAAIQNHAGHDDLPQSVNVTKLFVLDSTVLRVSLLLAFMPTTYG